MRWPRGRYNGRRIDGFQVTFHMHLLWVRWLPRLSWNYGEPYFLWLWFTLRATPSWSIL